MLNRGEKIIIKRVKKELEENSKINNFYVELYENFEDEDFKLILSSFHYNIIEVFKDINKRLLGTPKYIHANVSRDIIDLISRIFSFMGNMVNIKLELIKEYEIILQVVKSFIRPSGGTTIPDNFNEINIIETEIIFTLKDSMIKEITKLSLKLNPIGEGSYAKVYSFYDEYYDKTYVLKRLNENISEKDSERFIREFDTMKSLNSLFIAKAYKMNKGKKEYIMEYLDVTLYEYIEKNNLKLKLEDKEYIIRQVIKAFKYLEEKSILHRDISFKNILLKFYDDVLCVKITDFGLVKLEDSTLTAPDSEFRGSLNDPRLKDIGFDKYDSSYEMYALTRLIVYILTGKSNFSKIRDEDILIFLNKGVHDKKEERYQNINELEQGFIQLKRKLREKENEKV